MNFFSSRSSLLPDGSRSRMRLGRWRWLVVLAVLLIWPNALVPGSGLFVAQTAQAHTHREETPTTLDVPSVETLAEQHADD